MIENAEIVGLHKLFMVDGEISLLIFKCAMKEPSTLT